MKSCSPNHNYFIVRLWCATKTIPFHREQNPIKTTFRFAGVLGFFLQKPINLQNLFLTLRSTTLSAVPQNGFMDPSGRLTVFSRCESHCKFADANWAAYLVTSAHRRVLINSNKIESLVSPPLFRLAIFLPVASSLLDSSLPFILCFLISMSSTSTSSSSSCHVAVTSSDLILVW